MKNVFSIAIAAPILAMFVDIGAPTYRISGTWDQRNTDTLISGMMTTYSIGGVLMSLAFVLLAKWRKAEEMGAINEKPRYRMLPQQSHPVWDTPPPLPQNQQSKGLLMSAGPDRYEDLEGDFSHQVIQRISTT
jgi:hypothetical protein